MAKWNFAIAAVLLLAMSGSNAQPRPVVSGCTALARHVEGVVAAAAAAHREGGRPRLAGLPVAAATSGGRHTCNSTAAVASRAFTAAVGRLDVKLSWDDGWIRPGDYCLSHYLDQCRPSQDPISPLPSPGDFAFVYKAWQGVTQAVASQMPYGSQGDLASFSDDSLERALRAELSVVATQAVGELRESSAARQQSRR